MRDRPALRSLGLTLVLASVVLAIAASQPSDGESEPGRLERGLYAIAGALVGIVAATVAVATVATNARLAAAAALIGVATTACAAGAAQGTLVVAFVGAIALAYPKPLLTTVTVIVGVLLGLGVMFDFSGALSRPGVKITDTLPYLFAFLGIVVLRAPPGRGRHGGRP